MKAPVQEPTGQGRVQISSQSTNFYKWIFTPVWILGVGCFVGAGWLDLLDNSLNSGGLALLTLIWIGLGSFFLWWSSKLEHVWLDGDDLVVKRLGRNRHVPLSDVREISETRWSKVKTVTVKLRPGVPVGDQILFVPPWRPLAFLSHPLVKELYQKKALSGSGRFSFPHLL